jgi:hypothetical protein
MLREFGNPVKSVPTASPLVLDLNATLVRAAGMVTPGESGVWVQVLDVPS